MLMRCRVLDGDSDIFPAPLNLSDAIAESASTDVSGFVGMDELQTYCDVVTTTIYDRDRTEAEQLAQAQEDLDNGGAAQLLSDIAAAAARVRMPAGYRISAARSLGHGISGQGAGGGSRQLRPAPETASRQRS